MWFKNIALFEFIAPFAEEEAAIESCLKDDRFVPCGSSAPLSMGWVPPSGIEDGALIHSAEGCMMLAFKIEEKIVPAGVVKELLDEKVEAIELKTARKLRKKEKETLKEEIYQSLLPRAFTRSQILYAYIDRQKGWLVVNTAASKKAELLTVNLRKALGSLKIRIPEVMPIATLLTAWLQNNDYPAALTVEDQCVLQDHKDASGTIRCQRQDLFGDDIAALIESGREVVQLSLSWQDQIAFVINDELRIKSVKFLEFVQDKARDIHTETEQARFDADFAIMTATLREFIGFLLQIFARENVEETQSLAQKPPEKAVSFAFDQTT